MGLFKTCTDIIKAQKKRIWCVGLQGSKHLPTYPHFTTLRRNQHGLPRGLPTIQGLRSWGVEHENPRRSLLSPHGGGNWVGTHYTAAYHGTSRAQRHHTAYREACGPFRFRPTAKTSSLTPPHSPLSDCQPLSAGSPCVTPIPTQATRELSREGHRPSRPWRQTLCGGSSPLSFKASPPGTPMPISEPASLPGQGAPAYGTQQRGGAERRGKAKGAQSCSPVTRTASLPRPCERLSLSVPSFPSGASSTAWLIKEVPE